MTMQKWLLLVGISILSGQLLEGAEMADHLEHARRRGAIKIYKNPLSPIRAYVRQQEWERAEEEYARVLPTLNSEDAPHSQFLYAEIARGKSQVPNDAHAVEARALYEQLVENQNLVIRINAMYALVTVYRNGIGGEKNEDRAAFYENEIALYMQK